VAQSYSEKIAEEGTFEHSGVDGYGENLYWTSGAGEHPNVTEIMLDAVDGWYNEVHNYDRGTGVVGHFTQVIWNETTQLGMGIGISSKRRCGDGNEAYVVANYKPPGNVQCGHCYEDNVQTDYSVPDEICNATRSTKMPGKIKGKMLEKIPTTSESESKAPGKTESRDFYVNCIFLFIIAIYE